MAERSGWTDYVKPFIESNIKAAQESLESYNPVDSPSEIARAQGRIQALREVLGYVEKRT